MAACEAIEAFVSRGLTLATCESLTGGLVCATLTSVAGSSAVVRGGLVTYATDLKTTLAGVDAGLIEIFGVVSAQVARAMASGVRAVCGADVGLGVTGVAGPGPQWGVPAGTVWLGLADSSHSWARLLTLNGDRQYVRQGVVVAALAALTDVARAGHPSEKEWSGQVD
ncbi:MAG: CinA family protein [Propionibacteriaceae bacterium]|nr:CinA family protein [Propionibacteriaceae bacterium]